MIAISSDPKRKPFVCLSENEGSTWRKILDGNYIYTYGDYGNVIVAVEAEKPVREFIYSTNYGLDWAKVKFTSNLVYVDQIVKEQQDESASFALFCTNPKTNLRSIIKIDGSKIESSEENIEAKDELSCFEKCISKTTNQEICLTDKMKCDGASDCKDDIDEMSCIDDKLNVQSDFAMSVDKIEIKRGSFKFTYTIDSTKNVKNYAVSNYYIKIVNVLNSNLISNGADFKIESVDKLANSLNSQLLNFKNNQNSDDFKTFYEVETKKSTNQLDVRDLEPGNVYLCLFYADVQFNAENANKIYLLRESLVIKTDLAGTKGSLYMNVNEIEWLNILIFVSILFVIGFMVLLILLIKIKLRLSIKEFLSCRKKELKKMPKLKIKNTIYTHPVTITSLRNNYKRFSNEDDENQEDSIVEKNEFETGSKASLLSLA